MRADLSPTLVAARLLAARPAAAKPPAGSAAPFEARWCEWPRRATRPRAGLWQSLRQIQARHA
jgi:hypothetical protein